MCVRIGLKFQRLKYKEKIRIPMFITIRPEFQSSEGWGQNSNVYKNRARIKMFGRIRS